MQQDRQHNWKCAPAAIIIYVVLNHEADAAYSFEQVIEDPEVRRNFVQAGILNQEEIERT